MNSPYDDRPWSPVGFAWSSVVWRTLPFVLFILLAVAGMVTVYVFFGPQEGNTELVAAVRSSALSARFVKAVPSKPVNQRLAQSPGPIRIGIISGHQGSDSGAVCEDGLTEAEVNAAVANRVIANLRLRGIRTELLNEFDERLPGYSATALVSIHADSCDYYNEAATGFKIAGSAFTDSSLLSTCMEDAYARGTQLPYHANTLTVDMTDYHAFREIEPGTPAIIIETGFMNLDRELLTTNVDVPANAITEGILCFMNASFPGAFAEQ